MIPSDAIDAAALVMERWPHARLDRGQQARYAEDLTHLDAGHARAAIDSLHRQGRPHLPSAGEVARRVAEMQLDAPEWPEVRRQLVVRSRQVQAARSQTFEWECPYELCDGGGWRDLADRTAVRCECYEARNASRRGTDTLHPLVREWLDQGYTTLAELDDVVDLDRRDRGTLEAQMRDRWRSFIDRAVESRTLVGMPGAEDLPRLAAAEDEDRPRRTGGLRRMSAAAIVGELGA